MNDIFKKMLEAMSSDIIEYKGMLLVHTVGSFLPDVVQKFQMKKDPVSGWWNHSMHWFRIFGVDIVFEASYKDWHTNKGKLKNAGAYFNLLEPYLDREKFELLWRKPNFYYDEKRMFLTALFLEGTPYDFGNLLFQQIIYYKFGIWLGRKLKRASKTMVCHELTQNLTNMGSGSPIFIAPHQAQISEIYYTSFYTNDDFYTHLKFINI